MSKEIVNYRCGHTGIVDIYGAVIDRARKAQYIGETEICPDCLRAERAAASLAAAAAAKAMALPSLEGSEKQIAWAESIRAAKLQAAAAKLAAARSVVARMVSEARANYRTGVIAVRPTVAFLAQFLASPSCPIAAPTATLAQLRAEKSAKWFIDNR